VTLGPPISSHDYAALRESLADSGALLELPELHGGVSGALCAGGPVAAARWVDDFFADHEVTHLQAVHHVVQDLVRATWQMLESGDLAFEPLLPDEDEPLDEQVQALAHWCHGFLGGLAANAPELAQRVPQGGGAKRAAASGEPDVTAAEVAEILKDFAEISRAGLDEEDAEDRNTADFALAELKEYARVSAQIVFESLAERRTAAARDAH
jgi:hypothetical protein